MYFWGPYMWLAVPGLILGIYAQIKLSAAYHRYLQVRISSGLSGAQAARRILDSAGLTNVPIEAVGGQLTDHYDPRQRALFLSEENYRGQSISAVGVAAHETGHALQHQAAYSPLELRMKLVPVTQFASAAWVGIFFLGMFIPVVGKFLWVAIALFAVVTLF